MIKGGGPQLVLVSHLNMDMCNHHSEMQGNKGKHHLQGCGACWACFSSQMLKEGYTHSSPRPHSHQHQKDQWGKILHVVEDMAVTDLFVAHMPQGTQTLYLKTQSHEFMLGCSSLPNWALVAHKSLWAKSKIWTLSTSAEPRFWQKRRLYEETSAESLTHLQKKHLSEQNQQSAYFHCFNIYPSLYTRITQLSFPNQGAPSCSTHRTIHTGSKETGSLFFQ